MSVSPAVLEGRQIRMFTDAYKEDEAFLVRAWVEEGLSMLTETTIEFVSPKLDLDLAKIVGEKVRVELDTYKDTIRYFHGICVEAEYVDVINGMGLYRAHIRPWLWLLQKGSDCKIFQEMTVIDIIKQVFGDLGFSDYKDQTRGSFGARTYCVQYRESHLAFVTRLMEEEGIYFYFEHEKTKHTLVLADDVGAHKTVKDFAKIDFYFQEQDYRRRKDHIFFWQNSERVRTGKVTLSDYDFEKPKADISGMTSIPKGKHSYKSFEHYDYPQVHRESANASNLSRVRIEAEAAEHIRHRGIGNVRTLTVGEKFKLQLHERKDANKEHLIVRARHDLAIDVADIDWSKLGGGGWDYGEEYEYPDTYRCAFEVQVASEAFRAPLVTPRPRIDGVQTALVVGKSGEEIFTDKYGRVKVQFYWDRVGKKDEKSSCWVRVAMPWTGKTWGMMAVPRIGQEVVVQFEEGNPDRPLITGMLYNADTMPPQTLPANMTQSGVKTNKSKGGGGFNELWFEDLKEKEFVRFQSERDYEQIVKNNAEITIGTEHKDKGDLKVTIHNDKTEKIMEGNHTFEVVKGEETYKVKKDRTTTISGGDIRKVTKDVKDTISGAWTSKVTKSITLQANQKITLKCGGSKIEMTPAGITMKTTQFKVTANATAQIKANAQLKLEGSGMAQLKGGGMLKVEGGGMAQVKGGGLLMAKGGITLIN